VPDQATPDQATIDRARAVSAAMIRGGINVTLFVRTAPQCLRETPGR